MFAKSSGGFPRKTQHSALMQMDESIVQRFWNQHPCGDHIVGGLHHAFDDDYERFFTRYDAWRYRQESHILGCLDRIDWRGRTVLEIGLGQGAESEQLIRRGASWSGLDLTPESVDRVRARLTVRNLPYDDLRCGSALQIPYPDNSFDVVFSHGVLHHIPDIVQAQREIHRVLKPGGQLIAMLYARDSLNYQVSIRLVRRAAVLATYPLRHTRLVQRSAVLNRHLENAQAAGLRRYLELDTFTHRSTDGPDNPFARVYSLPDVARDFPDFEITDASQHYMHAPPLPVHRLPGARRLGWHLWVSLTPRASRPADRPDVPIVIATSLRADGVTGVQSYVRRLRRCLEARDIPSELVTPFSWGGPLTAPVFGMRLALHRVSGAASVRWYRYWHTVFLERALRRTLGQGGACVVYAQDPLSARAALRARRGPHQRVVMVVHFRISQADEWADKYLIERGGRTYRAIRRLEHDVIPQVDGLVYMSGWARDMLLDWLPAAGTLPAEVIGSLVTPLDDAVGSEPRGDLVTIGNLDPVKNHRFLLDVLAEANRTGRRYTLDIFGDGACRKDLLRQADELGVTEQVRFLGFQPGARASLPGYRAYVHACYSESFCLAIVEAMAAELPVVAADIGPIGELCDDGVEARFWPLDNPAKAADVLNGLLDSEAARVTTARAARRRYERDFNPDVLVARLLSFLAGVRSRGTSTNGAAASPTPSAPAAQR